MKKDLTLLIMAAGMGSRFGGLKQIEPFGPNGEFIIDYSVYDAIKAGFNKIVFVIKRENYDVFKETIGARVEGKIKVEYAFQEFGDISVPEGRKKPLGTVHAVLAAKDLINEPFAVINADDFYGYDAYEKIANHLLSSNEPVMIPYLTINTLSENGSVKRGVCEIKDDYLTNIVECNIVKENNTITASPLDGRESFEITDNTPVAMNVWGFQASMFSKLEKAFLEFIENNQSNMDKCEALLPDFIGDFIQNDKLKVKAISTTANWYGVTYPEDTVEVKEAISAYVDEGVYPNELW